MDILAFLLSINKISLLAFIATFGFIIYELRKVRKQHVHQEKPVIPQFDQSTPVAIAAAKQIHIKQPVAIKTQPKLLMPLLILMAVIFAGVTLWSGLIPKDATIIPSADQSQGKVVIQEVKSPGFSIFDTKLNEITKEKWNTITPGSTIIIGIKTIPNSDIDKARIRVNSSAWAISDITTQFDATRGVYSRSYAVPEDATILKIEAQLHSTVDGWLGE